MSDIKEVPSPGDNERHTEALDQAAKRWDEVAAKLRGFGNEEDDELAGAATRAADLNAAEAEATRLGNKN